jgi:diguanylate cyclase (GGDEF)-like protein
MTFEKPKEEIEKMRKRVEDLGRKDSYHEDSIMDLAVAEDERREKMKDKKISGEVINELADDWSTDILEKMEANKEKWIDKLTGLRNKNALLEEAPQILSLERRREKDCSFLMMDFDKFKKFNDEYGHIAGDEALKELTKVIKDNIRQADFLYRFGGEEFTVVLTDTDLGMAGKIAEKIRKEIESHLFPITDKDGSAQEVKRTVSIGLMNTSQLSDWKKIAEQKLNDVLQDALRKADLALYESKKSGRNKVILFEESMRGIKKNNNQKGGKI